MSNRTSESKPNSLSDTLRQLSLFFAKHDISEAYVAGGTVRDWLISKKIADLDIVIPHNAIKLAKVFATDTKNPFVLLDEKEDVARVIIQHAGLVVDFSSFRKSSKSIEQDLHLRDFTINSMAIPLSAAIQAMEQGFNGTLLSRIIDPSQGLLDLQNKLIKAHCFDVFEDDPLRAIRAFRFSAQLGFTITTETQEWIKSSVDLITKVSPERINHELDLILATNQAATTFKQMMDIGILFEILPELIAMDGVEQPGFHHLDVLGHSLEALSCCERLIADPHCAFPASEPFERWIDNHETGKAWLKWAAFLHDIAKPICKADKNGRATFYQHDKQGAELVENIASRLRWSNKTNEFVQKLVRLHMRPFHLLNDLRKKGPSRRAMRRVALDIGDDLPALFLLAMADTLAGCGPLKPENLEAEIALLWERLNYFYNEEFLPIKQKKRLIDGLEVQTILNVGPGPVIGQAIEAIEEAQIEGIINAKEEAIDWLKTWWQGRLNS